MEATAHIGVFEWQKIPSPNIPTAEAIVVLGGVTKSASPPRPTPELNRHGDRLVYAARLFNEKKAPLMILSGGRISWFGSGSPESADMAAILTSIGIPKEAIIQDPDALNTYENAINVKKILNSRGIKRVLLVTSAMHMPRSLLIFQHQGIDAIAAPTDFIVSQNDMQELINTPKSTILNLLPNSEDLDDFTQALKEYVGIFIYWLRGWL